MDRLIAAFENARDDLRAAREPEGHWTGELASSALATATAVSALALVQGPRSKVQRPRFNASSLKSQVPSPKSANGHDGTATYNLGPGTWDLGPVIERGIDYLATQQNPDGGFGDTDLSLSNIATTMLVRAAFYLTGAAKPDCHHELLLRASRFIEDNGGIAGLRARYGKDKTFAVPILTNCALAGLVDWREVSPLPFELAAFPQSWFRFFRLPVVSYAIPALVAIGQARYFQLPPRNPLVRVMRRAAIKRTLKVLGQMQPASGGYLEAIPLTSFVVMSLAGTQRADHPVVQRGVQFLLDTVRPDGSWPIDTNLATWVTTLAVNALALPSTAGQASSGTRRGTAGQTSSGGRRNEDSSQSNGMRNRAETWDLGAGPTDSHKLVEWLLACQHTRRHPFTGAAPGGWGWSDLSGAVPDVDDTAGALLALSKFTDPAARSTGARYGPGLYDRVLEGVSWLINLQNRDGGWPTFCRGWGSLPFDRSSPDLTAHACRAVHAWLPAFADGAGRRNRWIDQTERGLAYLKKSQRADGSWIPLWFGNQDHPHEENPIYGTSRVLLAYRDLGRMSDREAIRGVRWLVANQNADGGWGSAPRRSRGLDAVLNTSACYGSSVEETAWAVEALLAGLDNGVLAADNPWQSAIGQGVDWLVRAVEDDRHRQPAPVGFYFAKLWYYEKLYPLLFTVAALGEALTHFNQSQERVGLVDSDQPTAKSSNLA